MFLSGSVKCGVNFQHTYRPEVQKSQNFSENNFSCESMSKLEISRITKVLEYLDDYYEVTSSIVSELLNVEVKTASRLLSKAEDGFTL